MSRGALCDKESQAMLGRMSSKWLLSICFFLPSNPFFTHLFLLLIHSVSSLPLNSGPYGSESILKKLRVNFCK